MLFPNMHQFVHTNCDDKVDDIYNCDDYLVPFSCQGLMTSFLNNENMMMVVFPCLVTTYIEIGDEADGDVKVVMWSSK